MSDSIIVIPARMASTRLPNKPLADINGKPMILHVIDRALESKVGEVVVACCEDEVKKVVEGYNINVKAVITDPNHPSGTDRINEAIHNIKSNHEYIINVQGDLPTLDPNLIKDVLSILKNYKEFDISTLASPIIESEDLLNPNIVKPVISFLEKNRLGRALYFTRSPAPYGEGISYHHIGMYAYHRKSLEKFVSLQPSSLELREKLEQLRALENGMSIGVGVVNTIPLGVDTQRDLEIARNVIKAI